MNDSIAVKLRIEHSKKSLYCAVIITAIISIVICIIVAVAASPHVLVTKSYKVYNCAYSPVFFDCYMSENATVHIDFTITVKPYNQLIYLAAEFNSNETINSNINYTYQLFGINNATSSDQILNKTKQATINCDKDDCNTINIFYIPYITYSDYAANIGFNSPILAD